jgi:glycosyltransferase involved in cell wall biosynthesis
VVVHPGVDHRFFNPGSTQTKGKFRVCYVGRLEPAKGISYLIAAWRQLALRDAELVLVGRKLPGVAALEAKDLPASIKMTGILGRDEIKRCYQECDLFVFPSVNEGLSLSLLEAMSCGLPVVACKDTGADDCVVPEENGLLVPGRDADALADAIAWSHHHREDLLRMGRSARQTIEARFTLEDYAARVEAVYCQALKLATPSAIYQAS